MPSPLFPIALFRPLGGGGGALQSPTKLYTSIHYKFHRLSVTRQTITVISSRSIENQKCVGACNTHRSPIDSKQTHKPQNTRRPMRLAPVLIISGTSAVLGEPSHIHSEHQSRRQEHSIAKHYLPPTLCYLVLGTLQSRILPAVC